MQKVDIEIYNQPNIALPKSFFEGRVVPNFHPDSLDYMQWWDEQITRCRVGYSDGGYHLTGTNYYHINFKKINMLDKSNRPMFGNPYFSFEDQQLFNDINVSRQQEKGMMLITGRGFGKSFNAATVVEHEFIFFEATEGIISGSTDFFSTNLWDKVSLGINSVPDELRPSMYKDTLNYKESGVKVLRDGKEKVEGFRSKIWKVTYDNDPGKTRGTRPNIHVFEEVGSWSGAAKLIDCYKMTEPSWWRGSKFTCFPLLIGTGGQMETGASEDAEKMFNNPTAYNLMAFEYNDRKIGKFYPAYAKFGGYYEDTGHSDAKGAKEFLDNRRKEKENDVEMFRQEQMEFPYEPEEAFMTSSGNTLPKDILENQYANIMRTPALKEMTKRGDLSFMKAGQRIVGVEWRDNPNGVFEVVEKPDEIGGVVPAHLYIAGCDSFDASMEEMKRLNKAGKTTRDIKSAGCNIIYKRFSSAGRTGRMFVAKITQRTEDATEFYWNTVKLNMYYNSKMLYEYTKIGIGQFYITNKLHHLLYPRPKLEQVNVLKKTVSTNTYGIAMPDKVKAHAINRYRSYILENVDQMYFISQIKDAIDFKFGSSAHDETMAASIALLADDDMYDVQIRESEKNSRHFPKFVRDAKGSLKFA